MDENVLQKKALPNSLQMEQAVIGSMLMDRDAVAEVADLLTKEDFYYAQYGMLYSAIIELYNEGKPIDLAIVSNKLKEMGAAESVSNLSFIGEVLESVQFSSHAGEYAKIVQDKSVLRKMIKYAESTMAKCYESDDSVNDILELSEKDLFDITQKRNTGMQFVDMKEIALNVLDNIEASAKRGSKVTGVPTGFKDLDEKLTGLHGSELILIAARPAMGKTAFALNIAQYAAMKADVPVAVFSLEMSKEQLATRLIAMDSMVDSQSIRTGQLLDTDWDKIMESTYRVGEMEMYIDDTPGLNINAIRTRARRLKRNKGLGLIVIDYIQLITGTGSKKSEGNRVQEVSEISRGLKILAKELQVPVIALSQLNRSVESRDDKKPQMSDLRESGSIEQDADIVMFVFRENYYLKNNEPVRREAETPEKFQQRHDHWEERCKETANVAEVIVGKNRHGSTGSVHLYWNGDYTHFNNLAKSENIPQQVGA